MDKEIVFKFRFPVEQISQDTVVLKLPEHGEGLIAPNIHVTEKFKLSDMEMENMMEAAHRAAIRAIAIVRE